MPSLRHGIVALFVFAVACGGSEPTSPAQKQKPPPETPRPIAGARTFVFDAAVSQDVRGYTTGSSFVLYDKGTFELWFGLDPIYRGTYKESSGVIDFMWEGWSTGGSWHATGTVDGDILTVRYNLIMIMTDFEDAQYRLLRSQ